MDLLGIHKGVVIIEPFINTSIFFWIQLNLDWFQRLNIQDVVSIIQWRFFIIKWRKSHSLEVSSVPFLSPHHDPHGAKEQKENSNQDDKFA